MKEEYSKPKIGLLELDLEGTLCISGSNESSAVIDKITIDEEFKW